MQLSYKGTTRGLMEYLANKLKEDMHDKDVKV